MAPSGSDAKSATVELAFRYPSSASRVSITTTSPGSTSSTGATSGCHRLWPVRGSCPRCLLRSMVMPLEDDPTPALVIRLPALWCGFEQRLPVNLLNTGTDKPQRSPDDGDVPVCSYELRDLNCQEPAPCHPWQGRVALRSGCSRLTPEQCGSSTLQRPAIVYLGDTEPERRLHNRGQSVSLPVRCGHAQQDRDGNSAPWSA